MDEPLEALGEDERLEPEDELDEERPPELEDELLEDDELLELLDDEDGLTAGLLLLELLELLEPLEPLEGVEGELLEPEDFEREEEDLPLEERLEPLLFI